MLFHVETRLGLKYFVNGCWSENCVTSSATGATQFATTDTKLYVTAVTLSTEDNKTTETIKIFL